MAIFPKATASYSSVDCIIALYIFFIILALTSDSEFSTLSKFIFLSFLSYVVDLFLYDDPKVFGISSQAILKFQSGSLFLCHMASHLAGENMKPSCIAFVSIFFSAVVICLYSMSSLMGPPWIARALAYVIICIFATQVEVTGVVVD